MSERRRWPKPPPDVVEAGLRALAEELSDQYPRLEFVVHDPKRELPPGSRYLPGALAKSSES